MQARTALTNLACVVVLVLHGHDKCLCKATVRVSWLLVVVVAEWIVTLLLLQIQKLLCSSVRCIHLVWNCQARNRTIFVLVGSFGGCDCHAVTFLFVDLVQFDKSIAVCLSASLLAIIGTQIVLHAVLVAFGH